MGGAKWFNRRYATGFDFPVSRPWVEAHDYDRQPLRGEFRTLSRGVGLGWFVEREERENHE
jgi:hypothetical protein